MDKSTYRIKSSLIPRIGFVEYGFILIALFVGILGYILLSPRNKEVLITVRLADKDMIWLDNGSPRVLSARSIRAGMKDVNMVGKTTAEIVHVRSFDQPKVESAYIAKKTVYVTMKLQASHNRKTNEYVYQGVMLKVGEWVRFSVQSTLVNGLIVSVPEMSVDEPVWMNVKAQLKSEGGLVTERFYETTGVDKSIAAAVIPGDTVKDSDGRVLAEVVDTSVTQAMRTSWDIYGNVFNRPHPQKYDVVMTLRLAVTKIGDSYYYLDTVPIKINAPVPLFLSSIDIEPRVLEIISIGK